MSNKRILKHKVARLNKDESKIKYENLLDKIFLDVPSHRHSFMCDIIRENGGKDDHTTFSNYTIAYSLDRRIIWVYNNSSAKIEDVEADMLTSNYFLDSIPKSMFTDVYKILKMGASYTQLIKQSRYNMGVHKRDYITECSKVQSNTLIQDNLIKNAEKYAKKYEIEDGCFVFKYENVIAEDVQAEGKDIELGNLKFKLQLENTAIYLVDGSYPRRTEYNSNAYHPHHMSDGDLCFGTMSSDVIDAITNFELDILNILLFKFATSYNSGDSAGAFWTRWSDEDDDEEWGEWVETRQSHYDEDSVRWSEYRQESIHEEDAEWSDSMNDYLYSEDLECVRLINGDCAMLEFVVDLKSGGYIHESDEYLTYDGENYTLDEMIWSDVEEDDIPLELAVLTTDNDWILQSNSKVNEDGTIFYVDPEVSVEEEEETSSEYVTLEQLTQFA